MAGDFGYLLAAGLIAASAVGLTAYSAWMRVGKGQYLCNDCRFNTETDCLKAERPKAIACTSYRATDKAKK